jgi:hypothetical protein
MNEAATSRFTAVGGVWVERMSSGLVAWCCDYPWYAAAAVFLVANLLLLVDVGQDIPLLFPLRWLFSGPHRSTPEYARLKSKYLLRR